MAKRKKPKREATPADADKTGRAKLAELLEFGSSPKQLKIELGLSRKEVESELTHLSKSLAAKGVAIQITPAECLACGYIFDTKRRPFHAPGRCPQCKKERVAEPIFTVTGLEDRT